MASYREKDCVTDRDAEAGNRHSYLMAIRVWHISYVEAIGKPLFMMPPSALLCVSA